MTSVAPVAPVPFQPSAPVPVLTVVPSDRPDDTLSVDELGSRIVALAGRLAAATCRWLLLVADFDAKEGHNRFGLGSTARWLSHCCGIAQRTAVEHVRVARALAAFPSLAAAMTAGRLSYSHARAVARVAHPGEDRIVGDLIEVAEHGTVGQLETLVRGLRTVKDNEAPGGLRTPEPYVRSGWTAESQWRMSTRLEPERGAVVESALKRMAAAQGCTAADALVRLAELGLATLADGQSPPRELRGDERAAVVIHLDAGAVQAKPEAARSPERGAVPRRREIFGRIADGPGLPGRVIERLLCACRIRTAIIEAGGAPLDVGRSQRIVTARQFRALLLRDSHCSHPGCRSMHRLEAHHVRHWLYGGRTDLGNLVLLCKRHHHALHDDKFTIGIGGSRRRPSFTFRRADGRLLLDHVDPAGLVDTDAPVEEVHAGVVPDAAKGRRSGERLDILTPCRCSPCTAGPQARRLTRVNPVSRPRRAARVVARVRWTG